MKSLSLVFLIALAGCHAVPPTPLPPAKSPPKSAALPSETPATKATPEPKPLQQAQLIEALVSQNEALAARLTAATIAQTVPSAPVSPPATGTALAATSLPVPPPLFNASKETILVPNADGLIDLAAASSKSSEEPVNPFAVRLPVDSAKDLVLKIQGVIGGDHPTALVNERLLGVGDALESLRLERIETDTLYFRSGNVLLKVPASEQPVKVRGL